MAIKAFLSKNKNKVIKVIVPTDHLKIQWILELNKYQLSHIVQVEIINTASKLTTQVDLMIMDEVHTMAGDSFYQIFENRKPKAILGLSATFNRLDGRHELLAQHCPVCDTISVKEAIDNGWLAPYKEYKVLIEPSDIEEYRSVNANFLSTFAFFNNDFKLAMD